MSTVTLGEVLDRIAESEDRLSRFCVRLRDQARDNNVRLLSYYLIRRTRQLRDAVADLDADTCDAIRATVIADGAALLPGKRFGLPRTAPQNVRGGDLLEAALAHSEALARLYLLLLEQPMTMDAAVFLRRLSQAEQRDTGVIRKMIAMRYF